MREIKFTQAHAYYKGGNDPKYVVIHDEEYPEKSTAAEWCAGFFALPSSKASAHYAVDNDSATQMVKDTDGAWHCPGSLNGHEVNRVSLGIEHAGYAKQTAEEWTDEYSLSMLEISAELVAQKCVEFDIPPVRRTAEELKQGLYGITGHDDVTKATGTGSHWDPGPHFPWDWYMARVGFHYQLASLVKEKPTTPEASIASAIEEDWVVIKYAGKRYAVAPMKIWPIGIGAAVNLAKELGTIIPDRGLVDAIRANSDLKINGWDMVARTRPVGTTPLASNEHDGTMATMSRVELINDRAERLEQLIDGRDFRLLSGYGKSVVRENGVLGIYGMHDANDKPIQPFFSGHSAGWIDYSQYLDILVELP